MFWEIFVVSIHTSPQWISLYFCCCLYIYSTFAAAVVCSRTECLVICLCLSLNQFGFPTKPRNLRRKNVSVLSLSQCLAIPLLKRTPILPLNCPPTPLHPPADPCLSSCIVFSSWAATPPISGKSSRRKTIASTRTCFYQPLWQPERISSGWNSWQGC